MRQLPIIQKTYNLMITGLSDLLDGLIIAKDATKKQDGCINFIC
ncbi:MULTISPECIES: hypothetical protein [Oscillatoriales]|nr:MULTISPECIES: hypothetical protein [Oscillatoriales]